MNFLFKPEREKTGWRDQNAPFSDRPAPMSTSRKRVQHGVDMTSQDERIATAQSTDAASSQICNSRADKLEMSDPKVAAMESDAKMTVFLDTGVIIQYERGNLEALFSLYSLKRFRYVINPVVLQEIILFDTRAGRPVKLDVIRNNTVILPINMDKFQDLIDYFKDIRNKISHSNDLLILSNAIDCDYFVTDDDYLRTHWNNNKPKIFSVEEFQKILTAE